MAQLATDGPTADLVVQLRLTCLQPPHSAEDEPTVFGLQDRANTVDPGRQQPDGSVVYEVAVPVARRADGAVRFRGPHVHGTSAAPFLYLSLKRLGPAAETALFVKRLKVPLPVLAWSDLAALPGAPTFAATVAGTRSGTVPLLDGGWRHDAPG